jgi:hypothetical protein
MKTFKQLREDVDAKVKNPEAAALKPRATGEQDFVDIHKIDKTDYPVSSKGDNTSKAKHQPDNGDRGVIQQGTSKLADKSGFKDSKTPMTRADKTQGDFKPVLTAPSSVGGKWSGYATESVFYSITVSESNEDEIFIKFINGDSATINEDTYQAIQDTFEQLNSANQAIFHEAVNESAESFERILDFVVATYEEE